MREIRIIIVILIYRKLGSVGPVQQNIKLPSHYTICLLFLVCVSLFRETVLVLHTSDSILSLDQLFYAISMSS